MRAAETGTEPGRAGPPDASKDRRAHRPDRDILVAGAVIVRLEGATTADTALVRRQLGRPTAVGDDGGDVGLVIRFVDRLPDATEWVIGDDDAAWSEDGFIVQRSRFKSRARVRMDLDEEPVTVTCERGLTAIPHLVALVNLAALRRGILPLHAAAFTVAGRGVLATGWSKGGKTELVLGALAAGGRLVGDEWVYVAPDATVRGLGEPIRLWDWQLRQLPRLASRIRRRDRARLTATRLATGVLTEIGRMRALRGTPVARTAGRVAEVARRQLDVQVPAEWLAGDAGPLAATRADVAVFVRAWNRPDYAVQRVDAGEVAARMAASLLHERRALLEAYDEFRFAFPARRSELIETAPEIEARLLQERLGAMPTLALDHPRPFDIHRLWAMLEPHLRSAA